MTHAHDDLRPSATPAHREVQPPVTRALLSRLLTASVPVFLALLVFKLWLTGTLGYYVNDRTAWIVLIGGMLFALVGIVALVHTWRERGHGESASWRTAVFLIPVLIGLAVPARPLSASSGQSSSLGALQLTSHVSSGGGDAFGYWVSQLGAHPDASWWAGQHVTLVGFVAGQSGMPPRSFVVGRYLVTCCVVDATMLGFPVQLNRGRIPAQGAWVQVRGVFGRQTWTDSNGQQYPLIQHARLVPVSIPSSPYLSP